LIEKKLSFVKGMSDLLSPILLITQDEAEAFWLFERLMHRVGGNFDKDQTCCQLQLAALSHLVQVLDPPLHSAIKGAGCNDFLFCFRWMMVLLKREFRLLEVPSLWETLWTNPFSPHMHLYVALVLLEYRRRDILQPELHYGRMHEICGGMRGTVGLHEILADAEAIAMYAGSAGAACLAHVPLPKLPEGHGKMGAGWGGEGVNSVPLEGVDVKGTKSAG
jgi:hypothetical protein